MILKRSLIQLRSNSIHMLKKNSSHTEKHTEKVRKKKIQLQLRKLHQLKGVKFKKLQLETSMRQLYQTLSCNLSTKKMI